MKEELSTIYKWEWQRAQCVFDQMVALCDVQNRGKMVPRSCKLCGYYGHTAQYCPHDEGGILRQVRRERASYVPLTQADCTPEQWEAHLHTERIIARVEEGTALGIGCKVDRGPVTCASDIVLDCECGGCRDWRSWMAPVFPLSP